LEQAISKEGYEVVNLDYPSTTYPIEKLSAPTIEKALKQCNEYEKVHFVTHSLGGIILRHYLSVNEIEGMGRAVMLGPPNKGSEVVDNLATVPGFKMINGPAGLQ